MNAQEAQNIKWSENIIIVDGDYIDRVAFDLIVNFERMLNRRIPAADFSQWAVDIALDGRLKPGNHETQVVLLHDRKNPKLENFTPADYEKELNGQAFKDAQLGEFIINSIATGDETAEKDTVLLDLLKTVLNHGEVKRIMIVPNAEDNHLISILRTTLRDVDDELKHITVFAMQPLEGGNFKQQILGYSLLNAMGISSSEIERKIK
ncbi:hypothetical protein J5A51_08295 [Prevotella fusca JCM 17724]|uniref:Uncharacterized protein n=1 Tax=Prevotella fusca JCM 17724 TaxID=1236517 RepID=A0A0K1NHD8_9BACT|nr:DUF6621 family protein [Prevotella fusca]AKU68497.1 hypothetical protein ADJ77_01145 [Prevotella fusca JCM 17724]QUB87448.1 hypothetical protein J5A51_08295 [Prevotella fusca JCM 17724]